MAICPRCKETGELAERCERDGYHFVDELELARTGTGHLLGAAVAGKYVALSVIGEGGMGVIYRARQKMVGREVALKVLKKQFMEDETIRDRFIREAEVVAKLSHRNIVTLYDAGIDEKIGMMYMAIELLKGETLYQRYKGKGLPPQEMISVFLGMSSALAEAHKLGIYHRDLKPENVFLILDEEGGEIPKILDFGFARLQGASKKLTMAGIAFGTPHYMSPEQATGSEIITPACDIYAMGVMMYEAVTGAVPFDGKTPMEVMQKQVYSPVPPIVERAGYVVSKRLKDCIERCMQKEPEARYADGAALYAELQAIQSEAFQLTVKNVSVSLDNDEPQKKEARSLLKSTGFLIIVFVSLLLLLVFLLWLTFFA
ncbi:MAG: serine/threonine-protein kinase [Bradymonadales bacterium]|jgi:serine/threonine protein kinase